MKDCKITEFKSAVNSDLEKLGTITLPVKATGDSRKAIGRLGGLDNASSVHVKIEDGEFWTSQTGGTSLGSETDRAGSTALWYIANTDCNIEISKYNIAFLRSNYVDQSTGEFPYNQYSRFFQKDLSEFAHCKNLRELNLSPVVGDLSVLAKCIGITTIGVQATDPVELKGTVTGDLVEFAGLQIDNGRSTPFEITLANGGNRFILGSKYLWPDYPQLSGVWHVISKTKMYVEKLSTLSSTIWCYGYSDAEIEENTSAGGIWEGATVHKQDV